MNTPVNGSIQPRSAWSGTWQDLAGLNGIRDILTGSDPDNLSYAELDYGGYVRVDDIEINNKPLMLTNTVVELLGRNRVVLGSFRNDANFEPYVINYAVDPATINVGRYTMAPVALNWNNGVARDVSTKDGPVVYQYDQKLLIANLGKAYPLTWTKGNLPEGVTIDPVTCQLQVPQGVRCNGNFQIRATNSNGSALVNVYPRLVNT